MVEVELEGVDVKGGWRGVKGEGEEEGAANDEALEREGTKGGGTRFCKQEENKGVEDKVRCH